MDWNPRSAAFRANPYPIYQRLRTQEPIAFRPQQNEWLITRYADIVALLKDSRTGHLDQAMPEVTTAEWQKLNPGLHQLAKRRAEGQLLAKLWINVRNPPVHTRLHKLFQLAFTPQQINSLAPRIQTIAERVLDRVQKQNQLDIMQEFALPFTASIILALFDIPEPDQAALVRWSRELTVSLDMDTSLVAYERGQLALISFAQYFRELIATRRQQPQRENDLLSTLVQAQIDGLLSEEELLANSILLFITGHATTQHIIGNGMLALLRHPDQYAICKSNGVAKNSLCIGCRQSRSRTIS